MVTIKNIIHRFRKIKSDIRLFFQKNCPSDPNWHEFIFGDQSFWKLIFLKSFFLEYLNNPRKISSRNFLQKKTRKKIKKNYWKKLKEIFAKFFRKIFNDYFSEKEIFENLSMKVEISFFFGLLETPLAPMCATKKTFFHS